MGVEVQTISPGDGKTFPRQGQRVSFHYVATFTDGSQFDSSRDRRLIMTDYVGIGKFLRGLDVGLAQMSVGQTAKLTMTPDYAYGSRGNPPYVPPNMTLIFEVELLGIEN